MSEMKLVGLYENPKPEDAERIVSNLEAAIEVIKLVEDGWICVGIGDANTTTEEYDAMFEAAMRASIERDKAEIARLKAEIAAQENEEEEDSQ